MTGDTASSLQNLARISSYIVVEFHGDRHRRAGGRRSPSSTVAGVGL